MRFVKQKSYCRAFHTTHANLVNRSLTNTILSVCLVTLHSVCFTTSSLELALVRVDERKNNKQESYLTIREDTCIVTINNT
jgi:hypothetical protein